MTRSHGALCCQISSDHFGCEANVVCRIDIPARHEGTVEVVCEGDLVCVVEAFE